MDIMIYVFASIFLCLAAQVGVSADKSPPGCQQWDNITRSLNHMHGSFGGRVHMGCTTESSCRGFDCNGAYTYSGVYANNFKIKYCFGVSVNTCPASPVLSVYLVLRNKTLQRDVVANSTYQIPGASYSLGDKGKADGFVAINMVKYPAEHLMMISVKLKVRITVMRFIETWPDNFQQTLLPPTNITLVHCDRSHPFTPVRVPTCSDVIPTPPTTSSTTTSSPPVKPTGGSETYQNGCELGLLYTCSAGEECRYKNKGKNGVCLCMEKYSYDPRFGNCTKAATPAPPMTSKSTPLPPSVIFHHKGEEGTGLSNKSIIIIAVSTVVGVIVIGAIVAGVILIRRRNSRYEGHDLLLSADDSDVMI